jgi:hypothetical protein
MTPAELLDRCRSLGIDLDAGPDGALVWQADDDPPADLLEDLAANKTAVLNALRTMTCESCGRILDDKGRCWRCCDRRCPCGRWTGSAFIRLCFVCGARGTTEPG